jgi:glucan 1,3-beta-glucosidase
MVDQSLGIIDEYTLCERLPRLAPAVLRKHWDSFISFRDFQKIAAAGLNTVRIPIGY